MGAFKIALVTRADVKCIVAPRGRLQRNRTLAFVSRLFSTFEKWERREQHSNPARFIERDV